MNEPLCHQFHLLNLCYKLGLGVLLVEVVIPLLRWHQRESFKFLLIFTTKLAREHLIEKPPQTHIEPTQDRVGMAKGSIELVILRRL